MTDARLSKSTYLRGLQCLKALYLYRNHPELRDPIDPAKQARFDTGHEVGELAQGLFPGGAPGVNGHPSRMAQLLARTQRLIADGATVIYEAGFQYDNVLCYVDILVRDGDRWQVYEVKSGSSVKAVNYFDAAIQYYILTGSGLDLSDISIVHINTDYVRRGGLDLQQLFAVESVLEQVVADQTLIPDQLKQMRATLAADEVPDIDIGPYCHDPYDCDFIGHCWAHVPKPSVFDVARLPQDQKFGLYSMGVVKIEDIPTGFDMNSTSSFHILHHRTGDEVIDRGAIGRFVDSLTYPLYFLDFETFNPAIPPFDGTKPYGKIPFQYSLHRVNAPGDEPEHVGFLAESGDDPPEALADSLLEHIGESGDIVVYNQIFEKDVITQLADQLAGRAQALEALLPRLRDLMVLFQRHDYYHPDMNGSYSIKAALPVMAPGLSYEGMAISDGEMASSAFLGLQNERDPDRAKAIRSDLWEYCKLDTMAMVRILERLQAIVSGPASGNSA